MNYRVILQPRASRDINEAIEWLAGHSQQVAFRWFNGLQDVLSSLTDHPERCALAPESDLFPNPVRELLFGKRRGTYRILFTIESEEVHVIAVRHGARRHLEGPDEDMQ